MPRRRKVRSEATKRKDRARWQLYYKANREKLLQQKAQYWKANREKCRAHKRQHYRANRKKCLQWVAQYYKANREICRQRGRQYYEANREKCLRDARDRYHNRRRKKYLRLYGRTIRPAKHRQVMQQILRRKLEPGEHVRHRNGDRSDNRPENLELYSFRETAVMFGLNGKWAQRFDRCVLCGLRTSKHHSRGMCRRCYLRKLKACGGRMPAV